MNTWYWECIGWKIQCISPHTQPNNLSLFMDALHNEKNHLWHASLHKMLISTDTDYHTYNDQLGLYIQETATMTMYQPCPLVFNINKTFWWNLDELALIWLMICIITQKLPSGEVLDNSDPALYSGSHFY